MSDCDAPVTDDEFAALMDGLWRGAACESAAMAVAVSGGGDSMALCALLAQWARTRHPPLTLHALTVDHDLRPDAAQEAAQVGQWLGSHMPDVRHHILRRPKPAAAQSRIQEQARHDRYRLMAGYCADHDISCLCLAHHADDQAETVLFRLAKGSGPDGLAAMRACQPYDDKLALLRPLLEIPKTRLTASCAARNIPYVHDPSNENDAFARVRLRHAYDVLAGEGLTRERLTHLARRLARATEALDHYAAHLYDKALISQGRDHITWRLEILADAPAETRLRVLKKALAVLDGDGERSGYGVRMQKLEALHDRLFSAADPLRTTLGGVIFDKNPAQGVLKLEKEALNTN